MQDHHWRRQSKFYGNDICDGDFPSGARVHLEERNIADNIAFAAVLDVKMPLDLKLVLDRRSSQGDGLNKMIRVIEHSEATLAWDDAHLAHRLEVLRLHLVVRRQNGKA